MKKIFLFVLIIALSLISVKVFTQQQQQSFYILQDVKVENDTVKIQTTGPVKYNLFKVSDPPRIVIELFNTENDIKTKEISVSNSVIKRIRSGQFQNEPIKIARVVLDLVKIIDYESSQEGNLTTITLVDKSQEVPAEIKPAEMENDTIKQQQAAEALAELEEPEQAQEEPAAKPKPAVQPTPVPVKKPVVSAVAPKPVVTPVVKPKAVQAKKPAAKPQVKSKPEPVKTETTAKLPKTLVTLEYQEADIKDVLQVMSLKSGINIIYGPDVMGVVTISLHDVPFDQAFNTILTLKGLTSVSVSQNVLRVMTPDALKQERQREVTYTKIYPLNYAEANTIQSQIMSVLTAREIKGQITTDQRTNSLVVTATTEGLEIADNLLKELDIKPQQVMIQAKVVDLTLTDLSELGVNWTMQNVAATGGGAAVAAGGQTINPTPGVSVTQTGQSGSKIEATGIGSNMSVPTSGGTFNFGYVTNNDAFNIKLGALITEGKAKLLSNPRVTTINNKEAKILAGDKVPIKTTVTNVNQTTTESFSFLDTGVQLTVLPTISPDGWITLNVNPVVSVPGAGGGGGVPPPIKSRETKVTVMVKNTDTLVIGGLITETDLDTIAKVPFLSDLPLLGMLFKYRSNQKTRSELIIFITPTILPD